MDKYSPAEQRAALDRWRPMTLQTWITVSRAPGEEDFVGALLEAVHNRLDGVDPCQPLCTTTPAFNGPQKS
jgi:hypothetical protein